MIASEPLSHFVDDLLSYLHETHPTHATLDGVHTHDDLLEDVSRHAIESEAHALSGYLRRLDEINRDALTGVERLDRRQPAGVDFIETPKISRQRPRLVLDALSAEILEKIVVRVNAVERRTRRVTLIQIPEQVVDKVWQRFGCNHKRCRRA